MVSGKPGPAAKPCIGKPPKPNNPAGMPDFLDSLFLSEPALSLPEPLDSLELLVPLFTPDSALLVPAMPEAIAALPAPAPATALEPLITAPPETVLPAGVTPTAPATGAIPPTVLPTVPPLAALALTPGITAPGA